MSTTMMVPTLHHLPAPTDSLEAYLQAISTLPVLSADQEQQLAQRWHQHADIDAARQLVVSHLRFVAHIARGYVGYGLPLADLIQEGNIGLMKAVKRFDPNQDVRLVSFAVHWIKAEIHDFVLRNWRIVKVATTKAQRKLFFNLRRSKRRLGWFSHAEVKAVADDLGVPTEAVLEMESRLSGQDVSLDPTPQYGTDDDESVAPISYLADDLSNDPAQLLEQADWAHQTHQGLTMAMNSLDERSRDILQRRWLSDTKPTLHQLAVEYGVSAERIRQIENGAIKKLKVQLAA